MQPNAAEIVQIVREVTAGMAPRLEAHLVATYGPSWLTRVNAHLGEQGLPPGGALVERFCLAVFGHEPATQGWADGNLRQQAVDLFLMSGPAYEDQSIAMVEVVRAREIAGSFSRNDQPCYPQLPATPDQFAAMIDKAAFRGPAQGMRGYDEGDVDTFLNWVSNRCLTGVFVLPAEIQNVSFSKPQLGRRGYAEQEVDEFLDWMQAAVTALQSR
ncbi:hypothetical protein GCM10009765_68640 [Fodinicola feengrottensis]|uniref:Cell wall synthesis protein Wag31 n=1 Tax=Fodinicola feengrottensis TaxID=435914 RepID=A0ABP4UT41_9ACTN